MAFGGCTWGPPCRWSGLRWWPCAVLLRLLRWGGTGVRPVGRLAGGMSGADVLGPPSLAQGCAGPDASAPPPPPFPGRVLAVAARDVQGRMYAAVRRSVVFLWCKVDLFGWSWGCLDVGRRPWRREAWRSGAEPASQVRTSSHGFAGDVAAGGWRSRGVSAGCEHRGSSLAQFLAVGGGGRGRRILLEGSVAVLPPPALLRVKT